MLRQRLITIAILLPLFVWGVLALPTQYFSLLIAFVVLLGAWEWGALMGLAPPRRLAYLAAVTAAMLLCSWLITLPGMRQALLAAAVLWWLFALVLIRRFQIDEIAPAWMLAGGAAGRFRSHWPFGILGIAVLVPAWVAIVVTHGTGLHGGAFVLLLMLLVWGADSGAYVAGRLWGRTRLAPRVSPGKTWAGVYGAMVVAVLVAAGAGLWFGFGWEAQSSLVLLGLVTVLFSIVGDLFESMVKRIAGVKDSGQLLPGHGGVLDRIDSVTAAAPVFVLGLFWHGVVP